MTALRLHNPGIVWHPMMLSNGLGNPNHPRACNVEHRLARILGDWDGTPYVNGQACKREGVYCTAFMARVLDELYRRPPTPMPRIPPDASFHDAEGVLLGMRWFLREYPNNEKLEPAVDGLYHVQPADILITGPIGGGPGHAILVGPRENTMWEAGTFKVQMIGMMIPDNYELHAVYRMTDRNSWA